ncbi:MAG: cytochrome c oxidase subunit II [Anaerolineae bacterium]
MDGDRVLIVSAHPLFREGIIRLLGDRVEVVGTAADWEEARTVIQERRPQTVIVDHESAELKDTDLAPLLWTETETLKVIYVTLAGNEMIVHERRRVAGATEVDLLCALETTATLEQRSTGERERGSQRTQEALPEIGVSGRKKGGDNMRRLAIPILLTIVISIPLAVVFLRVDLTPALAGQQGQAVDSLLRLEFSIAAVIFVLCMVFLLYSVVAFRREPGDLEDAIPIEGSMPLEIAWTVVPLIIVIGLGFYGAGVLVDITKPPSSEKELTVDVTGFQWAWSFEYPELGITASELVLPVNQPVVFRLHATDVIHSFWIPEFRIKMDTIPGIDNHVRIRPTRVGEYKVRCAELCGTGHAYMLARVEVVEEPAFRAWVTHELAEAEAEPERGQELVQQLGCLSCHSTDGSTLVGPSWKGLYRSERTFQDGTTVVADDEYLRSSILDPGAQILEGFPDLMPKNFKDQLTEEQVLDIIEYIESLK